MEKEFVPYTLALALKELGFNEKCYGYYTKNQEYFYFDVDDLSSAYTKNMDNLVVNSVDELECTAPLYQQAFRWLRETHNIDVDVVRDSEVHYQDETRWIVKASNWNDIRVKDFPIAQLKFPNISHHTDFKTYNEALEKGLEEALKFIKK